MLDEGCIDQFLRCHLPRCDCPGGALRTPNEAHAAMVPMLEILRVEGVIARPPRRPAPLPMSFAATTPTCVTRAAWPAERVPVGFASSNGC